MRMFAALLSAALAVPASWANDVPAAMPENGDPARQLSSRRDTSDNAVRTLPVRCKPGDLERHPGRSLGDIFGEDWPPQPDVPAERRQPARSVKSGSLHLPAGMPATRMVVVSATLVAADGRPLRAEVLCASQGGLDSTVRRAAMRSRYEPARFDGVPMTGVAMQVWRFLPRPEQDRLRPAAR
ncbi:MAG TPA: hypothetical protein VEY50_02610 [Lysobacter sp.]|nr:hypothetical protein [Lysobacter sp.]